MRVALHAVIAGAVAASLAGPAAADDVTGLTCRPAKASAKLTLDFAPDVSIAELATWVAGITCHSVVVAPDVPRHATRLQIIAPRPLSPREAVKLFVNTLEAAGLEVRRKDRTFLISLGPRLPRGCPDVTLAAPGTDGAPAGPADGALPLDAERLAEKLAASIRRVDATHVEAPRALVELVLAHPAAFSRGARVVPAVVGGQVRGFKLYSVRPGSVYARLGLANGDVVDAINGRPLHSLEEALDAYSALRTADRLTLSVVRRGTPLTLTITITP